MLQVVGVLGLFVWPAPMTLKQIYLTITGVIVAFVFTWTPEWTTWTLLIAMAIYDMFAVLMPGGPLKAGSHSWSTGVSSRCHQFTLSRDEALLRPSDVYQSLPHALQELVQIAEERQVDIPALVYEARPVREGPACCCAVSHQVLHLIAHTCKC